MTNPESLIQKMKLLEQENAIWRAAWPKIEECLNDYAVHIHIHGGSLQPIPEIVAAKKLFESKVREPK